jgi:hypothetical protein
MANAIRPGDVVVVARTTQVHRGDVIVEQQTSPALGDYVSGSSACRAITSRVVMRVAGSPSTGSYSTSRTCIPGDVPSEVRFKVTVPKGHLWLLGDHRRVS